LQLVLSLLNKKTKMASIEIVLNPNPINIDVVQLPQTNIDIVYTTGGAVSSVNGQTGNVLINAVPDGGTTGQVLAKASNDDNDTEWINQQSSHPFLSLLGNYKVDANDTTPPAANGRIKYSNATQISSANLYVSAITNEGMDVEVLISLLNVGTVLLIQDENDAANYQKWQISSTPTFQSISDSYTIPVTLLTSSGTGTSNFPNNHEVFFSAFLSAANPVWGGITGTLSSQTDLQSALNAKQNSLGYTAENEANKDTDGTLAANSDTKYPSQKAAKTYIDTGLSGKENTLGFTPENVSNKDIDGTLAANSDTKYPSQKATKTYVDTGLSAKQNSLGFTPEDVSNKDIDGTLAANSDTKYPSQKAVKTYVDTGLAAKQNSLGFTPEDVSNKKGTINNSATEYPTSAAVLTGLADARLARVSTTTTATSITPNLDSFDQYIITTLASNITINASTGGANGSGCLIWIKDNGTARTINLDSNYVDLFGQVPATTTIGKWTVIGFVRRNEDSSKDHVIAGNTQS
jgi:disulfide oxidoreductase YuzD